MEYVAAWFFAGFFFTALSFLTDGDKGLGPETGIQTLLGPLASVVLAHSMLSD